MENNFLKLTIKDDNISLRKINETAQELSEMPEIQGSLFSEDDEKKGVTNEDFIRRMDRLGINSELSQTIWQIMNTDSAEESSDILDSKELENWLSLSNDEDGNLDFLELREGLTDISVELSLERFIGDIQDISENIKNGTELARQIKNAKTSNDVMDILLDYSDNNQIVAQKIHSYLMKSNGNDNLNPYKGRSYKYLMDLLYTNIGSKYVLNPDLLDCFAEYEEIGGIENNEAVKLPVKQYYMNYDGNLCSIYYDYKTDEKNQNVITLSFVEKEQKKSEITYYLENDEDGLKYCILNGDDTIKETEEEFLQRLSTISSYTSELPDEILSTYEIQKRYTILKQRDEQTAVTLDTIMAEFSSQGGIDFLKNRYNDLFNAGYSDKDIVKEVAIETNSNAIILALAEGKKEDAIKLCEQRLDKRLQSADNFQKLYDELFEYYNNSDIVLQIMNSNIVSLGLTRIELDEENNINVYLGQRKEAISGANLTIKPVPFENIRKDCQDIIKDFYPDDKEIYSYATNGGDFVKENIDKYNQNSALFTNYNLALSKSILLENCASYEDAFKVITGHDLANATSEDIEKFNSYYEESEIPLCCSEVNEDLGYAIQHYYKLSVKVNSDKTGFDTLFKQYEYDNLSGEYYLKGEYNSIPDIGTIEENSNIFLYTNKNSEDNSLRIQKEYFELFYKDNKNQVDNCIQEYSDYVIRNNKNEYIKLITKSYKNSGRVMIDDLNTVSDEILKKYVVEYIQNNLFEESNKYMQYGYTTSKQALYGVSKLDNMTNQYCMDMATYSSNLSHILSVGCMAASVLFPAASPLLMSGAKLFGYLDNGIDFVNMVTNKQNYLDDDYVSWANNLGFEMLTKAGYRYFSNFAGSAGEKLVDKFFGSVAKDSLKYILLRGTSEAVIETAICAPYTLAIKLVKGGEYNLKEEFIENLIYDFLPYARGWQDILTKGNIFSMDDGGYYYDIGNDERIYFDKENRVKRIVSFALGYETTKETYEYNEDNTYKVTSYDYNGKETRSKCINVSTNGNIKVVDAYDSSKIYQETVKLNDGFIIRNYEENEEAPSTICMDNDGKIIFTVDKNGNIKYEDNQTDIQKPLEYGIDEENYKKSTVSYDEASIRILKELIWLDNNEINRVQELKEIGVVESRLADIAALNEKQYSKAREIVLKGVNQYYAANLALLDDEQYENAIRLMRELNYNAPSAIKAATSSDFNMEKVISGELTYNKNEITDEIENEIVRSAIVLCNEYKAKSGDIESKMDKVFAQYADIDGELSSRAKSLDSTIKKLEKAYEDGNLKLELNPDSKNINTDNCRTAVTDAYGSRIQLGTVSEFQNRIKIESKGYNYDEFVSRVKHSIETGEKLTRDELEVIEELKTDQTQSIVDEIIARIRSREFDIKEINNYGDELSSYFTHNQLKDIAEAYNDEYKGNLDIVTVLKEGYTISAANVNENKAVKKSGYASSQITFNNFKDFIGNCEFQIRSTLLNAFAQAEHIPYDIRQGKITPKDKKYSEIYYTIKNMDNKSYKAYNEYLTKTYKALRMQELGFDIELPKMDYEFRYKDGSIIPQCEIDKISKEGFEKYVSDKANETKIDKPSLPDTNSRLFIKENDIEPN